MCVYVCVPYAINKGKKSRERRGGGWTGANTIKIKDSLVVFYACMYILCPYVCMNVRYDSLSSDHFIYLRYILYIRNDYEHTKSALERLKKIG